MHLETWPTRHYSEEDLRDTFDFMADRYVDQTVVVSRGHYPEWMNQVASLVKAWKPKSVADIGCGPGYLLRRLREAMPEADILGVDYSQKMLAQVPDDIPTAHEHLDDWADSEEKTYDALIMTFVLRDQPDPVQSLTKLQKRLAKNGHLVILETQTPDGWRHWGFNLYFHHWMPWWGRRVLAPDWHGAQDMAPYRWLSDSHRQWRESQSLPEVLRQLGYDGMESHRPPTDVVMLWSARATGLEAKA